MVVGRFAPSPSGRMHLGNVFTAMMAWLFARSAGGELLLRIEDLDRDRCRPQYAALLREDLRWLGLDWDREGQKQSERDAVYEAAFQELNQKGLLYPCYCTREELHAASAPHGTDGSAVYPGTCRNLTAEERAAKMRQPAWRIWVPDRSYGFRDGLQGWQEENLQRECGDFLVRRRDGLFAYQLAVVVDDAAMGVTQVVRGSDLLSSTPRQLYLYEQLSLPAPAFFHVPLLLAQDGRRLSKRDRDLDLGSLRERVCPETILGALAFTAGILEKPENISAAELLNCFQPEKIHRGNQIFSETSITKT